MRTSEGLKTNIKIAMFIEGNITKDQKDELLIQANACYIHRQIMGEWNIEHTTEIEEVNLHSQNN